MTMSQVGLFSAWKHRWALECEQASLGLVLELVACPVSWVGQLWGPRVVGRAEVEWAAVQQQSSLFIDTHLPLTALSLHSLFGEPESPPLLHVSISATPCVHGPYLLRTVFMRATDDEGGMVCEDVVMRQGMRAQRGRWVSRTVYDHAGMTQHKHTGRGPFQVFSFLHSLVADKEVFVVRNRVASGVWTSSHRPVPVLPKERVIVVHSGGWEYVDSDLYDDFIDRMEMDPPHCRVGYAKGEVVGQAVPQPTPDCSTCQRFILLGEGEQFGVLSMKRDKHRNKWIETIQISFEDESAIPVSYTPPTPPPSPHPSNQFVGVPVFASDPPPPRSPWSILRPLCPLQRGTRVCDPNSLQP